MASALDGYAQAVTTTATSEPTTTLLSNADGQPVSSAADAMEKLVAQLTRPVRWDLCNAYLAQADVTAIVEFPPAGALTGIAKRELRGVATHAVKTPADLDGLMSGTTA
jgi:[acyl-carrier-protein] S-malonyltransferase